jgi:hypothetical protein
VDTVDKSAKASTMQLAAVNALIAATELAVGVGLIAATELATGVGLTAESRPATRPVIAESGPAIRLAIRSEPAQRLITKHSTEPELGLAMLVARAAIT